jgi:polyribonucleotide nucleotidyltransferase
MINVEKYSYEEFKEIAMKVLTERENVEDENLAMKVLTERENVEDENLAMTIIDEVWKNMGEDYANIRDIIKIARLVHNVHDVKLITRTIFGTRRD